MIRVLVVDDSQTARQAIRAILESEPDIEIVGEAENGEQAVELTAQLKPDVITMDINMPQMNGYEATRVIMQKTPTPIVVVSSIDRSELMHPGFDILLVGALEIVQKPTTLYGHGMVSVRAELIGKVMELSHVKFGL